MIYLKEENTFDAKPGDFMIEPSVGFLELRIMVKQNVCGKEQAGWCFVCRFDEEKYKNEIIDGKPTPELIARFTTPEARESRKRFEREGETWVKTADGIAIVGKVRKGEWIDSKLVQFNLNIIGKYEALFYFDDDGSPEKNIQEAEAERERLIRWLEG